MKLNKKQGNNLFAILTLYSNQPLVSLAAGQYKEFVSKKLN